MRRSCTVCLLCHRTNVLRCLLVRQMRLVHVRLYRTRLDAQATQMWMLVLCLTGVFAPVGQQTFNMYILKGKQHLRCERTACLDECISVFSSIRWQFFSRNVADDLHCEEVYFFSFVTRATPVPITQESCAWREARCAQLDAEMSIKGLFIYSINYCHWKYWAYVIRSEKSILTVLSGMLDFFWRWNCFHKRVIFIREMKL